MIVGLYVVFTGNNIINKDKMFSKDYYLLHIIMGVIFIIFI